MALEREKTNVSIGNMPYVRPTNAIGDFAQQVQQDAIQERDRIYAEENRITVAETVASIYDYAKTVETGQKGVPNSQDMSVALGTFVKRAYRNVNDDVRRTLQAQVPGILSPIINRTVDQEVTYGINQNINYIETEAEDVTFRANDQMDESFGDEVFQKEYYAKIDNLTARLKKESQGRIPQDKIQKFARDKKIAFAAQIAARQYSELINFVGIEGAEKFLNDKADDFAKTFTDKQTFEQTVKRALDQTNLSDKIKKNQNKLIQQHLSLSYTEQAANLAKLEQMLPSAVYQSVAIRHLQEGQSAGSSDKISELAIMLMERNFNSTEDINQFFNSTQGMFQGKERNAFNVLRKQAMKNYFTDRAKEQATLIKARNAELHTQDRMGIEEKIINGELKELPSFYPSTKENLSYGDISKLTALIAKRKNYERNDAAIRTGTQIPDSKQMTYWESQQKNLVNETVLPMLESETFHTMADAGQNQFKDVVNTWANYGKLPTAFTDLYRVESSPVALRNMKVMKSMIEDFVKGNMVAGKGMTLPADTKVDALFDLFTATTPIDEIAQIRQSFLQQNQKGTTPANASARAKEAVNTADPETNISPIQQALTEMFDDGLIMQFGKNVFNQLLGHSESGAYDFWLETNAKLPAFRSLEDTQGFFDWIFDGADDMSIKATAQARTLIEKHVGKDFLNLGEDNTNVNSSIKTALTKLSNEGKIGLSTYMYQPDQKSVRIHPYPPESMIKDRNGKRITGNQMAVSIIEYVDQVFKFESKNDPNFSKKFFPSESQYRKGDATGPLDPAYLFAQGRLKLANPQVIPGGVGGRNQVTYQIYVIDQNDNPIPLKIPKNGGVNFNFTNAAEVRRTSASNRLYPSGEGFGDASIDTEVSDIFGGGRAGQKSGQKLDRLIKGVQGSIMNPMVE